MLVKVVPVMAGLYLVSPLDVIPDLFPLVGQMDDLTLSLIAIATFLRLCPGGNGGLSPWRHRGRPAVFTDVAHRRRHRREVAARVAMQLVFEQIRAGGDRNFGYVLETRDAKQAVLIDPSCSPEAFVQCARDQALDVTHVINTHGHPDHTNGNAKAIRTHLGAGGRVRRFPAGPTRP